MVSPKKQKPKKQYYGGSKSESGRLSTRNKHEIAFSEEGINAGLDEVARERRLSLSRNRDLRADVMNQRGQYAEQTDALMAEAKSRGDKYAGREDAYGEGADKALSDYDSGRGAALGDAGQLEKNDWMKNYDSGRGDILSGATRLEDAGGRSADMLEGYAQGAAGEYQSAADAAFQASQSRAQKNALGLAAGRGAGAIRTALATSNAGTQQAALDQQVVRAQEANQLNAMRNDAIAQAAGIRTGAISGATDARLGLSAQDQQAAQIRADQVAQAAQIRQEQGSQDQQAAQIQAARQEAARAGVESTAGMRAGLAESNIGVQRDMLGLVQNSNQADTSVGAASAGAQVAANEDQRAAYLSAEQTQNTSQLGSAQATEEQRQAYAKANSPQQRFKGSLDPGGILLK